VSAPASRLGRFLQLRPSQRGALLVHRARSLLRDARWRLSDERTPTYALGRKMPGPLRNRLRAPDLDLLRPQTPMIGGLCEQYLAHRFDILGSGWTEVVHGKACRGLDGTRFPVAAAVSGDPDGRWLAGRVNAANLPESQRLWRLVSARYRPIDWQLDFKSGFRWKEGERASRIRFGAGNGADVKVPWELGRLQHLPQLAHAYRLAAAGAQGLATAGRYALEFRDQVLDFVATNPPRYGVNWASPMDVAIRLANLLAARDLFVAAGKGFDDPFEAAFERSVYEHAAHVWRTLDWHPAYRGNHFLCEIAGLVFAASYLFPTAETGRWQEYAVQALEQETARQFLEDGANFEASTGYHRLSAEAVIYASALVQAKLPADHFVRVAGMARFVQDTARPDGLAPQIGDQDSGRFLKLSLRCTRRSAGEARALYATLEGYSELPDSAAYWDEEVRDHGHVVAAAAGVIASGHSTVAASWPLERASVAALAASPPLTVPSRSGPLSCGDPRDRDRVLARLRTLSAGKRARYEYPFGAEVRHAAAFPRFGLYVLRTSSSYLCIRCGPVGLDGFGAHAHNDALGIELVCRGRDVLRDPGSYLYTPIAAERERYRSAAAHFVPHVAGREPNTLGPGLFRLGNEARARCLYFGVEGFLGMHHGYGAPVYRSATFADGLLVIEDFSEGAVVEARATPPRYSPKYGARRRA
jgi:hypothetical protein